MSKHRCRNAHLSKKECDEITLACRDFRKRSAVRVDNPDENMYIGCIVHFITNDSVSDESLKKYRQEMFETLNGDFGERFSEEYIFAELNADKYPLLKNKSNLQRYVQYLDKAGDANIQFVSVEEDVRKYVFKPEEQSNPLYRNPSAWDLDTWDQVVKKDIAPAILPGKYLNMWIIFNLDSSFLGYGQFPVPSPTASTLATDGVVIFVSIFPFRLYKTATHEIGHWLSLNHIFHQDPLTNTYTDAIEDTPYQEKPTFGDPLLRLEWPKTTKDSKETFSHFMNYMDYTDDIRMSHFTKDQCARMRETLRTIRSQWLLTDAEVKSFFPPPESVAPKTAVVQPVNFFESLFKGVQIFEQIMNVANIVCP